MPYCSIEEAWGSHSVQMKGGGSQQSAKPTEFFDSSNDNMMLEDDDLTVETDANHDYYTKMNNPTRQTSNPQVGRHEDISALNHSPLYHSLRGLRQPDHVMTSSEYSPGLRGGGHDGLTLNADMFHILLKNFLYGFLCIVIVSLIQKRSR